MNKIVLVEDVSDILNIPKNLKKSKSAKIFSFTLEVHQKLQSENIPHEIADNMLNSNERETLFDKGVEMLSWSSKTYSKELEFEKVNLLKLFDSHEFHSYLIPNMLNFLILKKIIDKESPSEIICSSKFSNVIKVVTKHTNIQTQFFDSNVKEKFLWDNVSVKYNIGKIPISFDISKNKYQKMKKTTESFIGLFSDFWLDCKKPKKSIILLEFNTELFSNLLHELKGFDGNIILVNQRRSALWSKKAIEIVKNSGCKIVNFDKILDDKEKKEIPKLVEDYSKKFEIFWKKSENLEKLFQVDNSNFWEVIKDDLKNNYESKLANFILLIKIAKKIFSNMDVRCITSLNEVGETEKAFLEYNKKQVPSLLLEHGFVERDQNTKKFDKIEYLNFKDKFAVWGSKKKEFLIKEYALDPEKIIVSGSPRHDDYFKARIEKKQSKKLTVLIAPNPITEISGLKNTELELKFQNILLKMINLLKKFNDVEIIVKLHASQLYHNKQIKKLINDIDPHIPVFQSTPIIETINKADLVFVISSESWGTSTMILEAMILGKPVMNLILDKKIPEFTHINENAVLAISDTDDIEINIKKIMFDKKFQENLKDNADNFIINFLDFRGNASTEFAKILTDY